VAAIPDGHVQLEPLLDDDCSGVGLAPMETAEVRGSAGTYLVCEILY
jgi:hypothetical protein